MANIDPKKYSSADKKGILRANSVIKNRQKSVKNRQATDKRVNQRQSVIKYIQNKDNNLSKNKKQLLLD